MTMKAKMTTRMNFVGGKPRIMGLNQGHRTKKMTAKMMVVEKSLK